MGEIKYGLISGVDAACIEKTLDLVCDQFPDETINVCEVGLFNCQTSHGIHDYILSKGRAAAMTGIDNERDKLIHPPGWMKFIRGNSNEVYNKVPDGSQHFLFIDANHAYPFVIQDFFCFRNKVKVGAYMGFHDVAVHLNQLDGWQRVGDKNDPDFCLGGVRKALKDIGLFENLFAGWQFVIEDADINDEGGGVAIFRRIK